MGIYREAPSQNRFHVGTVPFAAIETTLELPPISLHAHIKRQMKERASKNSQRGRGGSK